MNVARVVATGDPQRLLLHFINRSGNCPGNNDRHDQSQNDGYKGRGDIDQSNLVNILATESKLDRM